MTETLFALVTDWGAAALALATFLSCLAIPVPTSLMMLAAGAFVATGDLGAIAVLASAFAGAVLGDQAGYALGRRGGSALRARLGQSPARARLLAAAEDRVARHGVAAVFLSRWLFSPLGPYVNLLAGGAGMAWTAFSLPAAAGEVVWVALYVGLGYVFVSQVDAIAGIAGNLVGLVTSILLAGLLGRSVLLHLRH